jgi:hypothetical protein
MLIACQAGKRCVFIVSLLAMLCGITHGAGTNANIVFILADDLGYGDVSCYNAQSKVPTPRRVLRASFTTLPTTPAKQTTFLSNTQPSCAN